MGLFDEISGAIGTLFNSLSERDKQKVSKITAPFLLFKLYRKPDIWMAGYLLTWAEVISTEMFYEENSESVRQEVCKKVLGNSDGIKLYEEFCNQLEYPTKQMDDGCKSAGKDYKEWFVQQKIEGPNRWYKYCIK
jgi:hypothetical protein|tara:strand:+ start:632 stop:1036 length:405 start_codon:yes stop_codon:yes gene_type:complete